MIDFRLSDFLQKETTFNSSDLDKIKIIEEKLVRSTAIQNDIVDLMKCFVDNENQLKMSLTNHKSFDIDPFNNLKIIDRGIHAARVYTSNLIHKIRYKNGDFMNKGIVICKNVFEEDVVENIYNEMKSIKPSFHKIPQNLILNLNDKSQIKSKFLHGSNSWVNFKQLIDFSTHMVFKNSKEFDHKIFVQKVNNKPDDSDRNKNIHSDTFYPSLKYWYFPKDVPEDGCFLYAKNSCNLTYDLLNWHYIQSILVCTSQFPFWKGDGHKEGSFRISENELNSLGYSIEPYPVKANTLVIANVFGFHARNNVKTPIERWGIHGSLRPDNVLRI